MNCSHANPTDCCDACSHARATCAACRVHASECTCVTPPADGLDHVRVFGAASRIVSNYLETEWRVLGTEQRSGPYPTRAALIDALRAEVLSMHVDTATVEDAAAARRLAVQAAAEALDPTAKRTLAHLATPGTHPTQRGEVACARHLERLGLVKRVGQSGSAHLWQATKDGADVAREIQHRRWMESVGGRMAAGGVLS